MVEFQLALRFHAGRKLAGSEFVEVGPGSVLTGLLRQIDKSKTGMNVENEATLQKVKTHFGQDKSKAEE